jgi:hypothetical protein
MSSAPHQTLRYYPKAQIRQGADRGPGGRRLRSHSKRRTTSIIVTMLAAPKRATNKKSPCAAARPQPSAASAESAASSRKRGSIRRQFHLAQSAPTRRCVATCHLHQVGRQAQMTQLKDYPKAQLTQDTDRDGAPDGLTENVAFLRQSPLRKQRQKQRRKSGRRDPTQGQN